jgi:hypothetical protein
MTQAKLSKMVVMSLSTGFGPIKPPHTDVYHVVFVGNYWQSCLA